MAGFGVDKLQQVDRDGSTSVACSNMIDSVASGAATGSWCVAGAVLPWGRQSCVNSKGVWDQLQAGVPSVLLTNFAPRSLCMAHAYIYAGRTHQMSSQRAPLCGAVRAVDGYDGV